MTDFHDELPIILERRSFTLQAASLAIGRSRPYFSNILRQKADPGLSTLIKLSRLTGLTIDMLARGEDTIVSMDEIRKSALNSPTLDTFANYIQINEKNRDPRSVTEDEPSLEDFFHWYLRTGANIKLLGGLSQYVDTYHIPKANAPRPSPKTLGTKSLVSRSLPTPTVEKLIEMFSEAPYPITRSVVIGHNNAVRSNLHVSVEHLDIPVEGRKRLSLRYLRTLFLANHGDERYILNYSKIIA